MEVIDIASSSEEEEDEVEEPSSTDLDSGRILIQNKENSGTNEIIMNNNSPVDHLLNRMWSCSFPGCNYESKSEQSVLGHETAYHTTANYECRLCNKFVTTDSEEYRLHVIEHYDSEVIYGDEDQETEDEADSASEKGSGLDTEKSDENSSEENNNPHQPAEAEVNEKAVKKTKTKRSKISLVGEKIWKCSRCCYVAPKSRCLDAHIRLHSDEKAVLCREAGCGYLSNRSSNMKCHLRDFHRYRDGAINVLFKPRKTLASHTNAEAMETSTENADQADVPVSSDSTNIPNNHSAPAEDKVTEIIALDVATTEAETENITAVNFEVISIEVVGNNSAIGPEMATPDKSSHEEPESAIIAWKPPSECPKFTCNLANHLQLAFPRRKSRPVWLGKLSKKMKKSRVFKGSQTNCCEAVKLTLAKTLAREEVSIPKDDDVPMPNLEPSLSAIPEHIFSHKNHLPSPSPPVLKCVSPLRKPSSVAANESAEINETTTAQQMGKETKPVFQCSFANCDFRTKYPRSVKRHIQSVHATKPKSWHSCRHCGYVATSVQGLNNHCRIHKKTKVRTNQYIRFSQCGYRASSVRLLNNHSRIHKKTGGTTKQYTCFQCGYHASSIVGLNNHRRTHKKTGAAPNSSKTTVIAPPPPQKITKTEAKNRSPTQNYSCQYCEHTGRTLKVVDDHMRRVHPEKKAFSCSYCDFSTKFRSNLGSHIVSRHKRKLKSLNVKPVAVATESKRPVRIRRSKNPGNFVTICKNIRKSLQKNSGSTAVGEETKTLSRCSFANCNFRTKYEKNLKRHRLSVHRGEKRNRDRSEQSKIQTQPSPSESSVESSKKESEDCDFCSYTAKLGGYLKVQCPVHKKKMEKLEDQVPSSSQYGAEEHSSEEQESRPISQSEDPQPQLEAPDSEFACKFCDFVAESPVAAAEHEIKHRRAVVLVKRV